MMKKKKFTQIEPLYNDAVRLVIQSNNASVQHLQRTFRIGYTRALIMLEKMEELGIVSTPVNGKCHVNCSSVRTAKFTAWYHQIKRIFLS